jgi:hypothetical protein
VGRHTSLSVSMVKTGLAGAVLGFSFELENGAHTVIELGRAYSEATQRV